MFTNSTSEQALLGKRFYIVLEIVAGGLTFYAATDYVRPVSSITGRMVVIDAILEESPVVELSEGWGETENDPPIVTFQLPITGLVQELKEARLLNGSVVSAYRWVDLADWDTRELLCSGRLTYSSDNGRFGTLSAVVEQDVGQLSGMLPKQTSTIPERAAFAINRQQVVFFSFGAAPDVSYPVTLKPYPFQLVLYTGSESAGLNYLGIVEFGKLTNISEIYMVCSDPALASSADSVAVHPPGGYNISSVGLDPAPVGSGSNAWGLTYYYHTYGKPLGSNNGQPIRTLKDMVEVLLDNSGAVVDGARMSIYGHGLDCYLVAGQIQEPTPCLEYLKDQLSDVFPVTIMTGARGLWVQPWRFADSSTAGRVLINPELSSAVRLSPVEISSSSVINDFSISGGLCRLRDVYTLGLSLVAERTSNQSNLRLIKSGLCALSQNLYGVREASVETDIIYDLGTMGLAASQQIQAKALPRSRVTYGISPDHSWLQPGDFVEVYDREVALSGVFLIDRLVIRENGVDVSLINMFNRPDTF